MSVTPSPRPLYLRSEPDPAFATVHRPARDTARDTGVIICPPFGWEEVCSYRSLRGWAQRLADDGYATIRVSLPGTGDSGGDPRDSDRVGAWLAAIGAAARWLRDETEVRRVAAIGIGLGGMLAHLSVAGGARIDDLVLWGTPARGRALVRQLRAFAQLERAQLSEGLAPVPETAPGEVEAGGFVMTSETVTRLEAVDLVALAFPGAAERRVLLLERDGLSVDSALRDHLSRAGARVSVAAGPGFADMSSHPQTARPPLAVIDHVARWLQESSERPRAPGAAPAVVRRPAGEQPPAGVDLRAGGPGGGVVRETPVAVDQSFGQLSGVLCEPLEAPDHGICVVLLNAGAVRRIGPSRMWVEAARRWAAQGVPTLRLDVEALGDSDGDESPYRDDGALYDPKFVPQVRSALDFLQAGGVGERFVLGGLCAGAYWSFHGALQDRRVGAVMLLNPRALIWTPELGPARDLRALITQPLSISKIRRLATGPRLHAFLRWVLAAPGRRLRQRRSGAHPSASTERDLDAALNDLIASGKRTLLLFSEHEHLHDELVASGREQRLRAAPSVALESVSVRDHTMRPSWAQRQVHAALDRALAREPQLDLKGEEAPGVA